MSDTTLAVARKCPKCNNVGTLVKQSKTADPEYTGYIFMCETKICLWGGTTWVVTADSEGVVPVRDIGHVDKTFPDRAKITDEQRKRIRETFDDVT